MMKKLNVALISTICCMLLLASCGAGSYSGGGSAPLNDYGGDELFKYNAMATGFTAESDYDREMASADSVGGISGYGGPSALQLSVEPRKVVTSAEFYITTDDFPSVMRRMEHKIAVSGSYVQQTESVAATEYRGAFASMTIRVPVTSYGDFKAFLMDLAQLDSSREYGEDVTAQFYDTEARLKVLTAQEERIKAFIAKANNLEEIFSIERELIRISTEIEQLTTVKNRLDNLTSYATVYVQISDSEFAEPQPVTFGERMNEALGGSFGNLVMVGEFLLLLLIWCWPLILIIIAAVLVWKKFIKHRRAGKKAQLKFNEADKDE
jgi:hypothetical protein